MQANEFRERLVKDTQALGTQGLLKQERIIASAQGPVVMLSDASPDGPARPSVNYVYVPEVDAVYERAVAARATNLREPQDWPWADRVAGFHDPADNRWWVATCLEDDPSPTSRHP